MTRPHVALFTLLIACCLLFGGSLAVAAASIIQTSDEWVARPFHIVEPAASYLLAGYSPSQMRSAYGLPSTGGAGATIAIVDAYDAPTVQNDLAIFSSQFGLPPINSTNFEIHKMTTNLGRDSGWAQETTLDVEWAHAIAPEAKILLVQAASAFTDDLLAAVDYARGRSDVVAISMSWGDNEYRGVTVYDSHFESNYGAVFYAASGDDGSGVIWPACVPNVVAVGGTTLTLASDGSVSSETGWNGSGGGVSAYEAKPSYQTTYGTSYSMRAVPDVSYNANPTTGVAIFYNTAWYKIGGTSAGAPQWAAIHALGRSATNHNFYQRAASPLNATYLRDIRIGSNGAHTSAAGYDLVTGLGSPVTANFGAITTENQSITLVPAGQSIPLSSTNRFAVNYYLNGAKQTAYASNGTLTLNTDPYTTLSVAGTSSGSTANEKWVFNSNGNPVTGSNLTLNYYLLLAQPARYSIVGGGNPPPPQITWTTAPVDVSGSAAQQTSTLALVTQTFWALIATDVSVTNPLTLIPTERWYTFTSSWFVRAPIQVFQQITYHHQVQLEIVGAQVPSQWYNFSDTAQISIPGVSNRASGIGQRTEAYSVDGSVAVQIQPTKANAAFSVLMDKAHRVQIISKQQYQVSLDSSAARMLASISQPTISGDNYWFDEGTAVSVALNGITSRTSGSGQRVTSYTVNGATTNVASTNTVNVVNTPMLAPIAVSASLVTQYQLNSASGSVKSITSPSLTGDTGWYNAGTSVTVVYDHSWSLAENQRLNAVGYTVNQGNSITDPIVPESFRQGNGTFPVELTMIGNATITVSSVMQYRVSVTGGNNVTFSPISQTRDSFFDARTALTSSTDRVWDVVNGNRRQALVSYSLNGTPANATVAGSENTFTTPQIVINSPQGLNFYSVTQYLSSFQFKDSTGTESITPTTVLIRTGESNTVEVPNLQIWLDGGTTFQLQSIIWQAAEVKPSEQTTYTTNAPLNVPVLCRVYNAELVLHNFFGNPVSGAPAKVTLANQTVVEAVTGSDGSIELGLIPEGTYSAEVAYEGMTLELSQDASMQSVAVATAPLTLSDVLPILAVVVVVIAVTSGLAVFLRKRKKR